MADLSLSNVKITVDAYEQLLAICARLYPNEACGVLARSEPSESIDIALPIRNVHKRPEDSFAFHPAEWTNTFFGMQRNRQQLVGFFHSHPHSHAQPSLRDYAGFLPAPGMTYWIVSLKDRDLPEVQPYLLENGHFLPVPLMLA
ncbi:M67 family peptidase [Paenibacillus sp. 1011MAR3C5]|uniref:Mov34/MPN/PAD-1 family protein n=1 Tax=Paenibacillus sp. 1011MAR3C5 TaxID=1675787 RepID=UPI000E6C059A|nr:M67 family metallopeptidase [Paenibacillus sp. 1011MAR3C5]RJE89823.1 M67 family peptidase [Paenibacillus sp. 1011MAR3C5]